MGLLIGVAFAAIVVVAAGVWAMKALQTEPQGPEEAAPAAVLAEPVAEPAAEPAAEPVAEPAVVEVETVQVEAPEATIRPAPVRVAAPVREAPPALEVQPEAQPQPGGPRLRSVKFAVAGATSVTARCGDVGGQGATSVLLREVSAGTCTVVATVDGASRTAKVAVDKPRGFDCLVEGETLSCR